MTRILAAIVLWSLCGCSTKVIEEPMDGGEDMEPVMEPLLSCDATPDRCGALGDERPGRLSEHTAVYDESRLELIVFGGTGTIPVACSFGGSIKFEKETWIYDDPCDKWTRVDGPGPSESGRHMAAMGDSNMWIFGGRFRDAEQDSGPYKLFGDLFRFDVAARRWQSVEVDGDSPTERVSGGLAWDSKRKRLWLFGGNSSNNGLAYDALDDLWSFDPDSSSWQQHLAQDGPSARLFHSMLYDERRDALVVYGGADNDAFSPTAGYHRDIWALDLGDMRWQVLSPGGPRTPAGRFWSSLVHDRERDAYLLFGGHDDGDLGNRNDTWHFDPESLSWSLLGEGDTYNLPANDVCDFPPDFSIVDSDYPERRSAHSLVWSRTCGHGLLFGGKTDCGAIDDVWAFEDDAWQQRLEATEGEACLRWRDEPSECEDMCF